MVKYLIDKGARMNRAMYRSAIQRGRQFARIVRPAYYAWRDEHPSDDDASSRDESSSQDESSYSMRERHHGEARTDDCFSLDDALERFLKADDDFKQTRSSTYNKE
jgi:hypothetical protein